MRSLDDIDLDRMAVALGSAVHVPYAPPHVYPMSAPMFEKSPGRARPQPPAGQLGLYVHVPFCNYACNFCFYAMRVGDGREQMERYVRALGRELEWVEPGTRLTQLFVGGGTPTALPADLLDDLLAAVFARFARNGEAVHTVECSPESISTDHIRVLRTRGVGRASMGIQTLDDDVLARVRRRHSGKDALAACERLLADGLMVNVDLIYGLPGQSEESFRRDFELVVACGVDSVCVYNLRINERTPVLRAIGREERLELARLVRWRAFVQDAAEELGFEQERWHTFKRPEGSRPVRFEDRTGAGDQLGIGLSARSRLESNIYRNHTAIGTYLARIEEGESPVEETLMFHEEDRALRFVAQSLGVGRPLERAAYQQTFGRLLDEDYGETIARLEAGALVDDDGRRVALTRNGRLVYDLVTLAFYPRHVQEWLGERQQAALEKFGLSA